MNFEDLQKAWKAQPVGARVTLDPQVLLKEVRRKQGKFTRTIFWRDVREVGVAAVLTWTFMKSGVQEHDWTLCLLAYACLGVGLFMVVDRVVQHGRRPVNNDTLRSCVESSLRQVTHQIWLLKNVFWWYVLPLLLGEIIFAVRLAWKLPPDGHGSMPVALFMLVFRGLMLGFLLLVFGGVAWFVTWLNQFAVRKSLNPRREQLENLLSTLD